MSFDFDIKPYAYQKEILKNLQAERRIFNRKRKWNNKSIYVFR